MEVNAKEGFSDELSFNRASFQSNEVSWDFIVQVKGREKWCELWEFSN